jgi:hypothetical protein
MTEDRAEQPEKGPASEPDCVAVDVLEIGILDEVNLGLVIAGRMMVGGREVYVSIPPGLIGLDPDMVADYRDPAMEAQIQEKIDEHTEDIANYMADAAEAIYSRMKVGIVEEDGAPLIMSKAGTTGCQGS